MNERIRQLADEAEAQYCDLGDASCFKRLGLVEAVVFKPEDLEKFAQLIVQECAGVCHTHGWGMLEHGMSGHNIADDCGTLIKQHFGVEE